MYSQPLISDGLVCRSSRASNKKIGRYGKFDSTREDENKEYKLKRLFWVVVVVCVVLCFIV